MQVVVTAVGPDNRGLADPIVHHVTGSGANIHEIQMYDHDSEQLFAMLLRVEWPGGPESIAELAQRMNDVGQSKGLSLRTWSRDALGRPPRLALCTTHRPEPALAVLRAIRDGRLAATPAVVIGNRDACRGVAEQFEVDWQQVGDAQGRPDNDRLVELFDQYAVDYIILARYMRILPPATCWKFAGGRIINLHHGLLPSFPGATPYEDAFQHRMLTYGSTIHFIVPEARCREPDHSSDHVHCLSGNAARGDQATRRDRSRTLRPGRRPAAGRGPGGGAALSSCGQDGGRDRRECERWSPPFGKCLAATSTYRGRLSRIPYAADLPERRQWTCW